MLTITERMLVIALKQLATAYDDESDALDPHPGREEAQRMLELFDVLARDSTPNYVSRKEIPAHPDVKFKLEDVDRIGTFNLVAQAREAILARGHPGHSAAVMAMNAGRLHFGDALRTVMDHVWMGPGDFPEDLSGESS